jgi:trk system potassium uptake protein TrkH
MPDTTKIHVRVIIKIMGVFLMIIALMMSLGLIFSFVYDEPDKQALMLSSVITFISGLVLFLVNKKVDYQVINKRDGFVIVSSTWVVISLFGTLPFLLSGSIDNFTDAFFETMSGFTTTGATILTDIEAVSKGILYWRSVTQWIGGMGVIVLALAIMPVLGIGGMQLYIAEMPGPTKDKLHPRITQTAKYLWGIYVLLTAVQALLMFAGGMSVFESVCHAFTTMATGGFSTRNESLAAFSPYIQYVVIVFMFLAGTSFVLLYYALHLRFKKVWESEEFRAYFFMVIASTVFITASLVITSTEPLGKAFRDALFQTISIKTTTGYVTTDYMQWQPFTWYVIFLLMFVGACAGSTSGGVKIVRQLLLFKNSRFEMRRLIHPKAIMPVRLNGKTVPDQIINNIMAFFIIYVLIFVFSALYMSILGLDFDSALGSVAATLGNVGPGIGKVGPVENYSFIPDAGKWWLAFLMLLGRLELFTVLVLFTATFWKR